MMTLVIPQEGPVSALFYLRYSRQIRYAGFVPGAAAKGYVAL